MKKLLLLSALLLMGASLFGAPSLAFTVTTQGTLEDKGDATRVRDVLDKEGKKTHIVLYYDVESEWKTVKFTVAAEKAYVAARTSRGGRYECKSLKINDEEKLTAPIILDHSEKDKKSSTTYKVLPANGKFTVVAEVRKAEAEQ